MMMRDKICEEPPASRERVRHMGSEGRVFTTRCHTAQPSVAEPLNRTRFGATPGRRCVDGHLA